LLEPEDEGIMVLQNFENDPPTDTAAEGVSFQQQDCERFKSSTVQYTKFQFPEITGS